MAMTTLVLITGAIPAPSLADELAPLSPLGVAQSPTAATPARPATVSQTVAQIASAAESVGPMPQAAPDAAAAAPADTPPTQPPPPQKPPVPKAAARQARERLASATDATSRAPRRHDADTADETQKIAVQAVGPRQVGTAAWYGGRYVGRRTSSGERLDRVHATAAHRTLPLNSLARVTNLDNGRSVVVRITDRGPVSSQLLIDMSPKAADQLAMKEAGIVRVAIEQVVEVPAAAK
jgi:rare lipoprotein A